MEKSHNNSYEGREILPNIDFLNDKLKLSFSFHEDAAIHLPEITDDELETHQEKYSVLLGEIQRLGINEVNIQIKGILEAEKKEKNLFYSEKKEHVLINMAAIKEWIKSIQQANPEFKNYHFVGDIHTHPVKPDELGRNMHSCDYSPGDFEDIRKEYDNGNLSADKPFIFCIAGRVGENTKYAFYRFIKRENQYAVEEIYIK